MISASIIKEIAIKKLGIRDKADCHLLRQTPFNFICKLVTDNKVFFIKGIKDLQSFKNEIQLNHDSRLQQITPKIFFYGKINYLDYPFLLIRDGNNMLSIDKLLLQGTELTSSLCSKIGRTLRIFHSIDIRTYFPLQNLQNLLTEEYKFFSNFTQKHKTYLNYIYTNANDVKAKTIIKKHLNIFDFVRKLDSHLMTILPKAKGAVLENSPMGLVHGDFWCQNILYNFKNNQIYFIDFNHSHLGSLYIDLVRFKQRGTSIKPFYSISELKIKKNYWESFLKGYGKQKFETTISFNQLQPEINLYLLIRTINHYLNEAWLHFFVYDSDKKNFCSKLLRQLIVLDNLMTSKN